LYFNPELHQQRSLRPRVSSGSMIAPPEDNTFVANLELLSTYLRQPVMDQLVDTALAS
jgi:hypothetical protein